MSYNVFADMGLPDPEMELLKCDLVRSLRKLIEEKDLPLETVSHLWSVPAEEIPLLLGGDWEDYAIERLFQFADALQRNVSLPRESQEPLFQQGSKTLVLSA